MLQQSDSPDQPHDGDSESTIYRFTHYPAAKTFDRLAGSGWGFTVRLDAEGTVKGYDVQHPSATQKQFQENAIRGQEDLQMVFDQHKQASSEVKEVLDQLTGTPNSLPDPPVTGSRKVPAASYPHSFRVGRDPNKCDLCGLAARWHMADPSLGADKAPISKPIIRDDQGLPVPPKAEPEQHRTPKEQMDYLASLSPEKLHEKFEYKPFPPKPTGQALVKIEYPGGTLNFEAVPGETIIVNLQPTTDPEGDLALRPTFGIVESTGADLVGYDTDWVEHPVADEEVS